MPQEYLDPGGVVVPESSVTVRRARELIATLRGPGASFASLIDCRSTVSTETVVFEVTVERPQIVANGIQRTERLAAVFRRDDKKYPDVLALRPDFPATLHLNQREEEFPRSLCLYNRPWSEVRTTWTAPAFVGRVRWWLGETAKDSLHADDQALESFIISWGQWLVLPDAAPDAKEPDTFAVTLPGGPEGRVFVAHESDPKEKRPQGLRSVVIRFKAPVRRHGVVPRLPKTVADLGDLLRMPDFDLLALMRERLRQWPTPHDELLDHHVILLIDLPKSRCEGGPVEAVEHTAFLTFKSVKELGVELGVWALQDKRRSLLLQVDQSKNGSEVKVMVLNVCRAFSRSLASKMNGLDSVSNVKVVAIGAGALGSQVAMNLARAGWGRWTIIDQDDLLPHNLARHALHGPFVGHSKASSLAWSMNSIFMNNETAAPGVVADVLQSEGKAKEDVDAAFASAEVFLDLSASVAVARHVAAVQSPARRISLFLSPTGNDLVLLGEDSKREVQLTALEMTYYTALATKENLRGHLDSGGGPIRYGLSCRDVSSRIPQDRVATLAGIGARAVRKVVDTEAACIRLWRADPESLGVVPISVEAERFLSVRFGEWLVHIPPSLLQRVSALRQERLPNETGGVLVGGIDHDRKCIYVMLALSSPPDSDEWPTHYIRGCEALRTEVEAIEVRTAGNLGYIGEWHSHPDGTSTQPSTADAKVFGWIAAHTVVEGKPPIMLIAGQDNHARLLVGVLDRKHCGGRAMPISDLKDTYDRRARLYPMVLVLLPLALGAASWLPAGIEIPGLVGGAVIVLAVSMFLTQLARDQGKRREKELFRRWGGRPSDRALSFAARVFAESTLQRWHKKLSGLDENLRFPENPEAEKAEPKSAKGAYAAATDLLVARTRDKTTFALLFKENMSYGFRRNLWGMKPAGIATAVLGVLATGARCVTNAMNDQPQGIVAVVAGALSLVMLVIWTWRVTPAWIRIAADGYAKHLAEACESL